MPYQLTREEIQKRTQLNFKQCEAYFLQEMAMLERLDQMLPLPFLHHLPIKDFARWNGPMQYHNNCMNVALNRQENAWLLPTQLGGAKDVEPSFKDKWDLLAALSKDPLQPVDSIFASKSGVLVALFHKVTQSMTGKGVPHWYALQLNQSEGFLNRPSHDFVQANQPRHVWVHKPGINHMRDAIDNNPFADARKMGMDDFLGYFVLT